VLHEKFDCAIVIILTISSLLPLYLVCIIQGFIFFKKQQNKKMVCVVTCCISDCAIVNLYEKREVKKVCCVVRVVFSSYDFLHK
jgi:hypothetical protein